MIGLGATLQVNDGAANAFASVTNLVTVVPPTDEQREVESKKNASLVVRYPTRDDPGILTFQAEYSRTEYNRLKALKGVEGKSYKITLANGDNFSVNGFLTKATLNGQDAETITAIDCSVRVTSAFATISAA